MKKILLNLSIFAVAIVLFASCNKGFDKNFDTNYNEKMVMINYAVDKPVALITLEPPATGNIELDLGNLSFSNSKPNDTEITINIAVNNSLLADYNTTHFTNIIPFPSNAIVMPLTYKIPAGQKQVALKASVNPALISLSNSYAIGISIASVTGDDNVKINTIYKDCLYNFIIKNKYDGVYSARIYQQGWTAYGIADGVTNTYPGPIHFETSGGAKSTLYNEYTGTYLVPGFSTTAATQFGAVTPVITFDPVTDKVIAITNTTPDDGRGRTLVLEPSITTNRYDPATKTVYCAFYLTQTGRPNLNFRDTFKFLRAR